MPNFRDIANHFIGTSKNTINYMMTGEDHGQPVYPHTAVAFMVGLTYAFTDNLFAITGTPVQGAGSLSALVTLLRMASQISIVSAGGLILDRLPTYGNGGIQHTLLGNTVDRNRYNSINSDPEISAAHTATNSL